jgi:hypothetical protein
VELVEVVAAAASPAPPESPSLALNIASAGLALCRQMASEGTAVVYATPHAHPPDSWFPITEERVAQVRAAYTEMKPRCAEFGLDLRLGWELAATGALVGELADYVLEGTRRDPARDPGAVVLVRGRGRRHR